MRKLRPRTVLYTHAHRFSLPLIAARCSVTYLPAELSPVRLCQLLRAVLPLQKKEKDQDLRDRKFGMGSR